jgi:hypothetical protein
LTAIFREAFWSHRICAGLTALKRDLAMVTVPDDPEALLRRDATAAALTEAGFHTSPKTLASLATRGGGPKFRKFGKYPVYRWGDALQWARAKLSPPVSSTAELDRAAPVGRRKRAADHRANATS